MTDQSDDTGRDRRTLVSRRMALACAASAVASVSPASESDAVPMLIQRAAQKNAAFMKGDMQSWAQLVSIAKDFTLMQPMGGPASHGFDNSPERLERMARYFRGGEAELEMVQAYASDAIIVLVMIERQRAEVGGLPKQDWSLRVTEVYRKAGADWELVHRHADPLVKAITLEQSAALARGIDPQERAAGGDGVRSCQLQ